MQITRPVRVWTHRRHAKLSARVLGITAALLVAGCSSRNPDALSGMNLDENAAMMNEPANQDANATEAGSASTNTASAPDSNRTSNAASTASANRARSDERQASAEADAVRSNEDNPSSDISSNNQSDQNEDQPLGAD